MNRNAESHFALNPTGLDMSRSKFNRPSGVKLTMNFGDIVPIYVDEVYPGDTFSMKSSKVIRMQTPLTPVMDNAYLDFYWFFVPNRLVWSHWINFMGENTESAWIPQTEYEVPQITSPATYGWTTGTIADYLGIPTDVPNLSVNALPFRAYALICNDWFRSEVLTDPLNIPMTDATVAGTNGTDYINDVAKGGMPFKAAKLHDYFTSGLPNPQRGPDVPIPIAQGSADQLPVYTGKDNVPADVFKRFNNTAPYAVNGMNAEFTMPYYNISGSNYFIFNEDNYSNAGMRLPSDQKLTVSGKSVTFTPTYLNNPRLAGQGNLGANDVFIPSNLWADGSGYNISVGTINQLRTAFQIQKLYEKDAIFGGRYISQIKAHFGVTSPDYRLQRPEYLGGNRVPITMQQVVQQSESGTTPQGTTAAFSLTTDVNGDFSHSFTEHGILMCVAVARYQHTYQQGIDRMFSRKSRFDYYYPVLANLGNQAILNKEIYAQGSAQVNPLTNKPYDEEVFAYQECWAELRYKPNRVAAEMRSAAAQSLDIWHYADDYQTMPFLSDTWLREDKSNVDRTLAVTSSVSNQLYGDFFFDCVCTRVLPLYSIPGLIDHH